MMAEPIISVQNLSKQYLISHVRDRALLSNYVEALLQKVKGFFSFFSQKSSAFGGENGKLNALDDVSFNIARGSRVGILGTNGAGKSTLLKILSNIIEPTAGKVKVNGNVISLLEVGIGFHAELTARENILLHRTIQAMPEAEIWKKIDEITDFAENEQFLDVPLSQYSSGMYMRFAFAMAAHLEPEILIVDEVLAVCDAAFQKKCIKKMCEISVEEGRTVLFVSHNLGFVRSFCDIGIYLENGKLVAHGAMDNVARQYESRYIDQGAEFKPNKHKAIYFNGLDTATPFVRFNDDIVLIGEVVASRDVQKYIISITITDVYGNRAGSISIYNTLPLQEGSNLIRINVPLKNVVPGNYKFSIALALDENLKNEDVVWDYPGFTIIPGTDENHFMIPKWQHSWGAHILSDTSIIDRF